MYSPKLLYVMPYYQTPTCYTYSIEKKRALIELAIKHDFYIIEEDSQSDFNYTGMNVTPLKALDYKNKVIYLKSFSKLLMPGLRLGFMTLPKPVLSKILSAKYTSDIDTSGFLQRAFSLFVETGGWYGHIAGMRAVFKKRYEVFIEGAERLIGDVLPFEKPGGGLSIWCGISNNIKMSSTELAGLLADKGVAVTPGDIFALNDEELRNIRLSFADIEEKNILQGLEKLSNIIYNDTVKSSVIKAE